MSRRAALQLCLACGAAAFLAAISGSASAAPTITNVAPRGLQIGQPTTLVVTGMDLPPDASIVLEAKIAGQTVKPGAKPGRIEIEVTLDSSTQPGIYPLRLAGPGGISNPVMIGVDALPQREFHAKLGALPAALSGSVAAGQVLEAKLAGKKGQRLVLDVEAQRLGSGLKPIVRLYDARGTQIAWSPAKHTIGDDARIDYVLPADAEYTIELHDQLFRPTGPGFFRLKVGDLQYADLAMPLGASAGGKQQLRFASATVKDRVELDAAAFHVPGETVAPLPPAERFTGAAPRITIADSPELVEAATDRLAPASTPDSRRVDAAAKQGTDSGTTQDLPPAPVAISGMLSTAGEEDKYSLAVTPGQKLQFDLVARQFGSPLDGVLNIQNENGKQLASGDDRKGSSDPLVDFTVPKNASKLQLVVKDLLGRGGSDFVYRLAVRDMGLPDFSLSLPADRVNIPAGGTQVIPVQVTRTNHAGPIELSLEGAPPELSLQGNVIPPGATIGLLTLSAGSVSPTASLVRLIGKAAGVEPSVVRAAAFGDVAGSKYQPRIRGQLGLAITQPSPINLAWLPGDNDQLFLGGKLPARVQFSRDEATKGKIRLKLLTSQPTPKKTVKEGNQDKVVDDVDRTLRLEGETTFGPDQKDVTVNVLVPSDLPKQPWDLVFIAELLSADGKNVVTSLAAPVRTLEPVAPFTLELAGPSSAEGKAGAGEPGKLAGKITRVGGYAQGVVVTLDNLPKGVDSPQVLVPADKSEFELPLTFGFSSKAGELKGVKLVALAAPVEAKSVRSNALDVAINLVQGEKPVAEPPKEIYEDDEKFVAMLTEGGGRAIPDQRDKYSGTYALRVTPDQKFNAKLPNLGVKIRENPGPGEYRYIRFAWKKAQGNAVCLQLAHDGKFGPGESESTDDGRKGAKFRYHAGPASDCYGASVQVSDKLPARFEIVTRDLFHDFGEFTFTGLGFSPVDGQAALFDHLYLARQMEDFELIAAKKE